MTDDRSRIRTQPLRLDEYGTGTLVAVIDTSEDAMEAAAEAAQACTHEWACTIEPYVLAADEVLAQDRTQASRHGIAARAYLFLASLVSDQGHLRHRVVEEAQLGHHVIVVGARDDTQVDEIWSVLRRHGAHDGVYIGRNTTRELVQP